MRKTYARPALVEIGTVERNTLGSGGSKPDLLVDGTTLIDTNTDCSDPSPNTSACLVFGSPFV